MTTKLQRCKLLLLALIATSILPLSLSAETPVYDLGSPNNTMRAASNSNPVNLPAGWLIGGVPIGSGNYLRSGSGVPSNGLGVNGDFYIRTDTSPQKLYGPKAAGVWPAGVDMGSAGAAGQGVPIGGTAGQVLAKTDGTNFNTQWITTSGTGTVTSIATTAPLSGGTITTTGTLSISLATTSTNGYLSSADWNIFNGKLSPTGNASGVTGLTFPQISGTATDAQTPNTAYNNAFATITQSGATLSATCDTKKTEQNWTTLLTANVTTFTVSSVFNGAKGNLIIKQDGIGSRTLVLPASSKVVSGGGGVITLTTSPNAIDVLAWTYDGTNYLWTYGKNFN